MNKNLQIITNCREYIDNSENYADALIMLLPYFNMFEEDNELYQAVNDIVKSKFNRSLYLNRMNNIGEIKQMNFLSLDSFPDREFIFERLGISPGIFALVCATGCSGKTLLIQYLACLVSSGLPLLNQPGEEYTVTKGSVVHIDGEQSELQTSKRYARIANGLGITDSISNIERVKLKYRLDSPAVNPLEVEQWLEQLLEGKTLAIIDSLKAVSETDENSPQIEIILKMFKRVSEKTNCAILLVHHKGKQSNSKQSGRGHSSIYDSVDLQIDLEVSNKIFELSCAKMRDGDFFDGLSYTLSDEGDYHAKQKCSTKLVFKLNEANIKSKTSDQRTRILDELNSAANPINQGDLYDIVKGDTVMFKKVLDNLVESNIVEMSKGARGAKLYALTADYKATKEWK